MNPNLEKKIAAFDEAGEDVVRKNIASGVYAAENLRYAELWLARRERERSESSQAEQISIARSAKDAAWAAAEAARDAADEASTANHIAWTALGIAIISGIAAIFALVTP
jgi:hypothetical protein